MQRKKPESSTTFTKIPHANKDRLPDKLKETQTAHTFDYSPLINNTESDHFQELNTVNNLIPQLSRKDKLVQELEHSLGVIDDHSSDLSRIEKEKTVVEMERNNLLKEMEETIFEIQSHVVNAKELELEKKVIEEECNDLREQVEHLRRVLESSNGGDNDSLGARYEEANTRNQALEEELMKFRSQNEVFLEKGHHSDSEDISVSAMERELELLHEENFNLRKQLQMAEESEDNMALELTESNSKITELQATNEALAKEKYKLKSVKEQLELECDDLTSVLEQLRLANSKLLQDTNNADIVEQASEEDKNALRMVKEELEKIREQSQAKEQKIRSLEGEIKSLKDQQPKAPQANGAVPQKGSSSVKQLKSVLEKLNKENALLHESVEKSEEEILSLKELLKEEKASKESLKETSNSNSEKPTVSNQVKDEGQGNVLSEEVKRENESLKKARHQLTAECDALSETVARTAKEKRKMEEEIESRKEEISKQKMSMDELDKKIQDLEKVKVEKEALEQTLTNQKKQYRDLNKKYENANQNYYEKSSDLERAQLNRDHMDKKCQDLYKSVEKIKKELSDAQHEMLTRADEVKFLKQKHGEEKNVLTTSLETDHKLHRELQNQVRSTSEKLNATEAEKKAIESSYQNKTSELNDLKKRVEDMKVEAGDLWRQLSQTEKAKLEAEERAEVSDRTTNELQKAQAVSSDLAMEKSLELSRTKRILEKKIERLMKENLELKKKIGQDSQLNSARSSPITVETKQITSFDVDLRLAALRPPPRNGHSSERDLVEQDRRLPEEVTVSSASQNYARLEPRGHWHGKEEVKNGHGEGKRRLSEEIIDPPVPKNYARSLARDQWHGGMENGLGKQDRFPEEGTVQPVAMNYARSAPRSVRANEQDAQNRMPEERMAPLAMENVSSSAYRQKHSSFDNQGASMGNRSNFSVNRVKVTAANKPHPTAPMAYRISQSEAVEHPRHPVAHNMHNSHGYERKKPERVSDNQRREPFNEQAHYAYQMLKERSVAEQNASNRERYRNGPDSNRHRQPALDPPDSSNSVFQVVGYRKGKTFIHEHYV